MPSEKGDTKEDLESPAKSRQQKSARAIWRLLEYLMHYGPGSSGLWTCDPDEQHVLNIIEVGFSQFDKTALTGYSAWISGASFFLIKRVRYRELYCTSSPACRRH